MVHNNVNSQWAYKGPHNPHEWYQIVQGALRNYLSYFVII